MRWFEDFVEPMMLVIYAAGVPITFGAILHVTGAGAPAVVGALIWPATWLGVIGWWVAG